MILVLVSWVVLILLVLTFSLQPLPQGHQFLTSFLSSESPVASPLPVLAQNNFDDSDKIFVEKPQRADSYEGKIEDAITYHHHEGENKNTRTHLYGSYQNGNSDYIFLNKHTENPGVDRRNSSNSTSIRSKVNNYYY